MSQRLTPELFKALSASYWQTHTVCRAPGCKTGWVETGGTGYFGQPETKPCKVCKGNAAVKRQLDLFPETAS